MALVGIQARGFFLRDGLDLRGTEEGSAVDGVVALAGVDQVDGEESLAAVLDLVASVPPSGPGIDGLGHIGGGLGGLDALGVHRLGLLAEPGAVESFGEGDRRLAEDPPGSGHDGFQIVGLFHCRISFVQV